MVFLCSDAHCAGGRSSGTRADVAPTAGARASRSSARGGTSGLRGCVCAWGAGVHGPLVQQRKSGAGYFVLQFFYGNIILLSALALICWFKTTEPEVF